MHIITSPWRADFERLIKTAKKRLRVVAPFYGDDAVKRLLQRPRKGVKKFFLFAVSERCVKAKSQSIVAIKRITKDPAAQVRFLQGLHAKFLIADSNAAVVTSANLTNGGLNSNLEMGVWVNDQRLIKSLVHEFDAQWTHAEPIDSGTLKKFESLSAKAGGGKRKDKGFGARVRLKKKFSRPPSPETPELGWILFHSAKAFKGSKDKTPIVQLDRLWKPGMRDFDWNWKGVPMKEDTRPHTLLLAWNGEVFGEATATMTRTVASSMRRRGYTFAFLFTRYKPARHPVPFTDLAIGPHRSYLPLTRSVLATYRAKSN